MSALVKSEICQGCLSSNRQMSQLGALSPLLYNILDKDTRLGQMAISIDECERSERGVSGPWQMEICSLCLRLWETGNLVQTDPHLCWECLRMLQNVHKFQQRVYRAQSALLAAVDNRWHQDFPVLSTLSVKKLYPEDIILNGINTEHHNNPEHEIPEHHNNLEHEIPLVEYIKTETKIEEDESILDEDGKVSLNKSENFKLEDTDDSTPENNENFSDSDSFNTKPKSVEAKPKKRKFRGTKVKKKYQTEEFKTFKRYITAIRLPQPETIPYTEFKYTEKKFKTRLKIGRCYNKFFTNKPFKCRICVIGYENENELFEHMKIHDQEFGDFSCELCKVYFKTEEQRQEHIEKHLTCYKCKMCNNKKYIALRIEHLRDHVDKVHLKAYQCKKCDGVVRTCQEFYVHFAKEHMKYTCDYCGHISRYKRFLEKHIVRSHLGIKCEVCKQKFSRFYFLVHHSKVVHNIDIKGSKESTMKQENMYCVECDRQFVTFTQFRNHLNNSMNHGKRKRKRPKITCPDCGKLFATAHNLKRHFQLIHEKITNYHCEICNKYCASNYQLKRHSESVHQKIRPPKDKICAECGQAFNNKRTLDNHMRTHTRERPYACALCPATFTQEAPLYTHVKRQHGKKYSRLDKTFAPKSIAALDSDNASND